MAKINNGKAVIYTDNGVEIVPAEIRRSFNVHGEMLIIRPFIGKGTRYIIVGGAKTVEDEVGNIYAAKPMPYIIERATKYAKTKFFRLILDLMKLAQFDTLAGSNGTEYCFLGHYFSTLKNPREPIESDINFDVSIAEIDAQLYKKYQFTPAMINFVERRYSYDDG